MSTLIDKQTQVDLEIFHPIDGSIYDIFIKNCNTIGGRNYIFNLLNNSTYELTSTTDIHQTLSFLDKFNLNFEFKNYQIEFVEEYINAKSLISRPSFGEVNAQKVKNFIADHKEYKEIENGVKSLFLLIENLKKQWAILNKEKLPLLLQELYDKWLTFNKTIQTEEVFNSFSILIKKKLKVKQVFLLDSKLRTHRILINEFLSSIFKIDAYNSISKKLREGFHLPQLNAASSQINLTELFHPLLQKPISNSINLQSRVIILTGANMAGKSTLLRSIGICTFLAQLGLPVPASKVETIPFDRIISSINLVDSLQSGESYYLNEVKRIKTMIDAAKSDHQVLVLLDEVFRGTNIEESIELGKRLIAKLTTYKNCIFIISTHFHSLFETFKNAQHVSFLKMNVEYENDNFKFTYKVEEGISKDYLATKIAEHEGLFD